MFRQQEPLFSYSRNRGPGTPSARRLQASPKQNIYKNPSKTEIDQARNKNIIKINELTQLTSGPEDIRFTMEVDPRTPKQLTNGRTGLQKLLTKTVGKILPKDAVITLERPPVHVAGRNRGAALLLHIRLDKATGQEFKKEIQEKKTVLNLPGVTVKIHFIEKKVIKK